MNWNYPTLSTLQNFSDWWGGRFFVKPSKEMVFFGSITWAYSVVKIFFSFSIIDWKVFVWIEVKLQYASKISLRAKKFVFDDQIFIEKKYFYFINSVSLQLLYFSPLAVNVKIFSSFFRASFTDAPLIVVFSVSFLLLTI